MEPEIQNPMPSMPDQMPPMPSMPSMNQPAAEAPMVMKKKSPWLWIILAIIVALGLGVWWYIGTMVTPIPVVENQPVNQEARQDTLINAQIDGTDLGNVDAEMQSVNQDLNSL